MPGDELLSRDRSDISERKKGEPEDERAELGPELSRHQGDESERHVQLEKVPKLPVLPVHAIKLAQPAVLPQEVHKFLTSKKDRVSNIILLIASDPGNYKQALDEENCLAEGALRRIRYRKQYRQLDLILYQHRHDPIDKIVPS